MFAHNLQKFTEKSNQATEELVQALKDSDYSQLKKIMKAYKPGYLNTHYRDSEGNTLLHIALQSASQNYCTKVSFTKIVEALIKLGVRADVPNTQGILPKDLSVKGYLLQCLSNCSQAAPLDTYLQKARNLGGPLRFFYKDRTRIHPGVRLTNQLDLHLGSKNPEKVCEVPNKNPDLDKLDGQIITLHQRLALSAAHQSAGDSSVNNYVTINIGFVVSETPHAIVEKAQRRRKFITLPLRDPQFGVYWKYFKSRRAVHSEEVLYSYLSNEAPCTSLIDQLESKYGITPGFKIYALIIDMHSLNNVCKECTSLTYDNQFRDSFLQTIENILADRGYILPKVKLPCPDLLTPSQKRLHLVTRISSSRIFDSDNIEPFSEKEEILVPVFEDPIIVRDIKKFGNAVILKDTKQTPYKKVWSKGKDAITDTGSATVAFSNQTAFINFFSKPKWGRRQWCEKYTTSEETIVLKLS